MKLLLLRCYCESKYGLGGALLSGNRGHDNSAPTEGQLRHLSGSASKQQRDNTELLHLFASAASAGQARSFCGIRGQQAQSQA